MPVLGKDPHLDAKISKALCQIVPSEGAEFLSAYEHRPLVRRDIPRDQSSKEIQDFILKKDYEKATSRFGEIFYQPLHDFFEQVMVNVEDPTTRYMRQELMRRINRLYTERLADLSVLSRLDQG